MRFGVRLYEVGYCYVGDRHELTVEVTCSNLGVWQVEVREHGDGGRRIATRYDNEQAARKAVEAAYTYGRQFGRWRIDRARTYVPDTSGVPVTPAGRENTRSARD